MSKPVFIVGAGPAGLFAALNLILRGVPIRLVDKKPTLTPVKHSKALVIHSRSLEILSPLGLLERLLPFSFKCNAAQIFDGNNKQLVNVSLTAAEDKTPFPFMLVVQQGITERVLYEKILSLGGKVELGVEVLSFEEHTDGVRVKLSSGEEVDAAYLVACDGAHSPTRKALGFTFDGKTYHEHFVLGDVVTRGPPIAGLKVLLCEETSTLILPLSASFVSNPDDENALPVTSLDKTDSEQAVSRVVINLRGKFAPKEHVDHTHGISQSPLSEEEFSTYFKQVSDLLGVDIIKNIWLSRFGINARITSSYSSERVFLCGDAAHIHSPMGGQGMNTGFGDVFNLVWKLALVYKGHAAPGLLKTYGEERSHIGKQVIAATDAITNIASISSAFIQKLRNFAASFLQGFSFVQHEAAKNLTMTGYNYHGLHTTHGSYNIVGMVLPPRNVHTYPGKEPVTFASVVEKTQNFTALLYTGPAEEASSYDLDSLLAAATELASAFATHLLQLVWVTSNEKTAALIVSKVPHAVVLIDHHAKFGTLFEESSGRMFIRPDRFVGAVFSTAEPAAHDIAYLKTVFA